CKSMQTFVTFLKGRNCNFMTDSCTFSRICVDRDFTFINNSIKLNFTRNIQIFSDMFQTAACVKCFFSNTDTEHITLSCMIYALDTVDIVMELTLDNRLEVRLHILSGNFYNIGNCVLASQFHPIYVRTYNG